MPKSPAFSRIKSLVLQLTSAIPFGKVATYRSIGDHLEVPSRHVAYILATLSADEEDIVPWYRVVSENGKINLASMDRHGHRQAELLQAEGITISGNAIDKIEDFLFEISESSTGIPYQPRPLISKTISSRKKK